MRFASSSASVAAGYTTSTPTDPVSETPLFTLKTPVSDQPSSVSGISVNLSLPSATLYATSMPSVNVKLVTATV